jgi:CBS domain containing-hemolysin-like protein
MMLVLILAVHAIIKAGEIYLLTLSKQESDLLAKREGSRANALRTQMSRPELLFGTLFQITLSTEILIAVTAVLLVYSAGPLAGAFLLIILLALFGYAIPDILSSKLGIRAALIASGAVKVFSWFAGPVNRALCSFSREVEESREERDVRSVEEFTEEVDENDVADVEEKRLLLSIVRLSNTCVSDIMTPRVSVVALEDSLSTKEVLAKAAECGFSRMPVYENVIDNVTGFLYIKDLVGYIDQEVDWRKYIRKAYFVPGSKKINDLLEEFRQKKIHLAVVADEYGGMEGIVTLEDILEEIVGEISDESDKVSKGRKMEKV